MLVLQKRLFYIILGYSFLWLNQLCLFWNICKAVFVLHLKTTVLEKSSQLSWHTLCLWSEITGGQISKVNVPQFNMERMGLKQETQEREGLVFVCSLCIVVRDREKRARYSWHQWKEELHTHWYETVLQKKSKYMVNPKKFLQININLFGKKSMEILRQRRFDLLLEPWHKNSILVEVLYIWQKHTLCCETPGGEIQRVYHCSCQQFSS